MSIIEIRLDSERNLDLQKQNCLLGIETMLFPSGVQTYHPSYCCPGGSRTTIPLLPAAILMIPMKAIGDLRMGKVLGSFPATKGKIYRLLVQIDGGFCNTTTDKPGR